MRLASIDIGTNSTRLLIFERSDTMNLQYIDYREEMTQLGAGLSNEKRLSSDAMQRVIAVLNEYKKLCAQAKIQHIRIFATSATRDAVNRLEFMQRILQQTQLECQILSGKEEAEYSFFGAVSDFQPDGDFAVCDIGGGSTEIIFARKKKIHCSISLNIGSSRLTRHFFTADPPCRFEVNKAKASIMHDLVAALPGKSIQHLICTGGTAATLALMDLHQPITQPLGAHHHRLNKQAISKQIKHIQKRSLPERQRIVGLHPDRAGLILGGALIMQSIMDFFDSPATISLRDVMHGIWIEGESQ